MAVIMKKNTPETKKSKEKASSTVTKTKNVFGNRNKGDLKIDKFIGDSIDLSYLISSLEITEDVEYAIQMEAKKHAISESNILILLKQLSEQDKNFNIASLFSKRSIRYLVSAYYNIQKSRIMFLNQARKLVDPKLNSGIPTPEEIKAKYPKMSDTQIAYYCAPHNIQQYFGESILSLENMIGKILKEYVESKDLGRWLMSITGIGPIIAAGLLAHVNMTRRITTGKPNTKDFKVIGYERIKSAGQLQRFAGLDPTIVWKKGQLRPFNKQLKVLLWKAAQSFMMLAKNKNCMYGKLYTEIKEDIERKNEEGYYAEYCEQILKDKDWKEKYETSDGHTTSYACYKKGKLPKAHIIARACRKVEKLLLCHIYKVFYEYEFHEAAPVPYEKQFLGHVHMIDPPNYDLESRKEFNLWIPDDGICH